MAKRILAAFMVLIMLCAIAGCKRTGASQEREDETKSNGGIQVELTQRQRAILLQHGLPTNCEELNDRQVNDIMAIEDMLVYLEKTYGVTAEYEDYIQASALNDSELLAKVNGQSVTVKRRYENGKFVYEDNFAAVAAVDDYEAQIEAYFNNAGYHVQVFSIVDAVDEGDGSLLSRARAAVYVFVGCDAAQTDLSAIALAYGQWYSAQANGKAHSARIYAVSVPELQEIVETNYLECIREIPDSNKVLCRVSYSGAVSVD